MNMEEKIYQKLIDGLKNSPLSEITIREQAKLVAEVIDTDEALDADSVEIPRAIKMLETLSGQYRRDVKNGVLEGLKNHPKTSQTEKKEPKEKMETETEVLSKISAYEQKLLEIEQRLENQRKIEVAQKVKKDLAEALRKNGADNPYIINSVLEKVSIEDNYDLDKLSQECISKYDADYAEVFGMGVTPRVVNNSGNDDTDPFADFKKNFLRK